MTKASFRQSAGWITGYGVGDFGLNIYWNILPLFLMFWYVQILGLEPVVAGWIWFLGLAWDAISDPIIAAMAAKNRSRFGTYRPFLLIGSFALGLSFFLLFWVPPIGGFGQIAFLLFAAILFRTCYTMVAIPYAALSARITFDSKERSDLAGVRMIFAFLGNLCVTTMFLPLVRLFGDGSETSSTGFLYTAAIGAIVATIALIICFLLTHEEEAPGGDKIAKNSWYKNIITAFRRNAAFPPLLLLLFLNTAAGASAAIPFTFYLEANSAKFANKEVVLSACAVATLIGTPIWTYLARRLGKKRCWYIAAGSYVIWSLALLTLGPIVIAGVPIQFVAMGFSNSAFAVIIWVLIPDTVEYGQYCYGERDEGTVFGCSLFAQKASGGLAGLIIGQMLTFTKYDADNIQQTAETAQMIGTFLALVPMALIIAATLVLYMLPITGNLHARIIEELSGSGGGKNGE